MAADVVAESRKEATVMANYSGLSPDQREAVNGVVAQLAGKHRGDVSAESLVSPVLAERAREFVRDVVAAAVAVDRVVHQYDDMEAVRGVLLRHSWHIDDDRFEAVGELLGIEFAYGAFMVMSCWLEDRHGSEFLDGAKVPRNPEELWKWAGERRGARAVEEVPDGPAQG